jgi:uncharacterized protein
MNESLLEFPCDFPVKAMGRKDPAFRALVIEVVERHAGPLEEARISARESRDGNFIALTLVVRAHSQAQLDAIYGELSAHDWVLMAL